MKQAMIIKSIKNHIQADPISFHTPGHKGGNLIPDQMQIQSGGLWEYDLTEIPGLDNLHKPEGCIKEAQEEAARLFKAKKTHFLVNGSSVGIHSAIMALAHDKYIFVPRHVHKSIYNATILANAKPIYLPVAFEEKSGIPLGIEPEVLKRFILDYPKCKVIILPNPNYQGISYQLEEIIYLAKKNDIKVIIDEAHGSHFLFHKSLPKSGLELGADIVIQSWHKTLPVLTQGSVLHEGNNYQGPDLSPFINMLQTTSPSYLLLASLDSCRVFLAEKGQEILEETYHKLIDFNKKVTTLTTFTINFALKEQRDFLKLNLSSEVFSGLEIDKILRERFQIFSELSEENYILFIFSLKVEDTVLNRLLEALTQIDQMARKKNAKIEKIQKNIYNIIPEQGLAPRDAFYGNKKMISLDVAVGRICGEFILKYPPGIPLVVPGEMIDFKMLEILKGDIAFRDKREIMIMDDI
ncbi:Orn/Lys/Arg decarboxylase, C-terminal domain [Desulfonispora thiosulfatigenes DSM 11270]|uniref:Orn/Lys/Arg decarboxylase, C-terminal domain n=1 Tax=Desulfonispora thiosulfatigenes DSM 11270 TaxID=656914 RepID=A0A1W1V0X5_DESTI|nr:aminotransferase class I/II-fold pyridoxal phosphate-dependent enzyme [Desulfonispora thiosulfatigenes]SMB86960.1 Orn/Lys/Arg decarboxylase, C-terminal domain [Desulfonispora thiosulfatigenes DSM 11270]